MAKKERAKAVERLDEKPVKLNLSLSAELAKRFGVHAECLGVTKSALLADMVRQHCRRFVIHDRDRGAGAEVSAEGDTV